MAENEIHALVDDLHDQLRALFEPRLVVRTFREPGNEALTRRIHQVPSLYDEVRDSLGGMEEGVVGHGTARSVPPLWMDALTWLDKVDRAVVAWAHMHRISRSRSATEAARALIEARFRPQDHFYVAKYAKTARNWVDTGSRLVAGRSEFGLRDTACPDCGKTHVRRQMLDGWGKTEALQASMDEVRCLACHHTWDKTEFRRLGRLLGCESPEEFAAGA